MNVTSGILNLLENEQEPIVKRLELAEKILKSPEELLKNQEPLILKWIINYLNCENLEPWEKLHLWLTSKCFENISLNETIISNWTGIIKTIITTLPETEKKQLKEIVVNITFLILENKIVQFLLKKDIKLFFKLTFVIIQEIEDKDVLLNFLKKDLVVDKTIIKEAAFTKLFIKKGIYILVNVKNKFHGDQDVSKCLSNFVGKAIYQHSKNDFDLFYSSLLNDDQLSSEKSIPVILVRNLKLIVKHSTKVDLFRLIFEPYCHFYRKNFDSVYKFLIIISEILGFPQEIFKFENFEEITIEKVKTSENLDLLVEMLKLISEIEYELDYKIKDVSFEMFLENFLISIVKAKKNPSEESYDIFIQFASIIPLSIERKIDILLPYVLLTRKSGDKYSLLLNAILNIFAKLHRVQSFVSKTIKLMKQYLCDSNEIDEFTVESGTELNIVTMFPALVQDDFSNCIAMLASWQVMNIFKTLLFHLKEIKDDFEKAKDSNFVLYIEILSTFVCLFLTTSRIVEHTATSTMVKNFLGAMNDLQEILSSFGNSLVRMEHTPRLMQAYLNICYNWADLLILIKSHCNVEESFLNFTLDSDYSGCNLTYLHSYLTGKQWCLISERITNFGEASCKIIMHKLLIQKSKALSIFEKRDVDEYQTNIIRTVNSNVRNVWMDLLNDRFSLKYIVPKLEINVLIQLADLILEDYVKNENKSFLNSSQVLDCLPLIEVLSYVCLSKMSNLFREKRKNSNSIVKTLRTYTFSSNFAPDNLTLSKEKIINFNTLAGTKWTEMEFNFNDKKFLVYYQIFTKLPIQFLSSDITSVLFFYFLLVLLDFVQMKVSLKQTCEDFITALLKHEKVLLEKMQNLELVLKIILKFFKNYDESFIYFINYLIKHAENVEPVKCLVDYLLKNIQEEKCCKLLILSFEQLKKSKKNKTMKHEFHSEIANCQKEILERMTDLVISESDTNRSHSPKSLCFLFKNLGKISENAELISNLQRKLTEIDFTNFPEENTDDYITFFTITLTYFKVVKDVNVNIREKIWNFCKTANVDHTKWNSYSQLVILLFEHMSNEEFSKVSSELIQIDRHDFDDVENTKIRFLFNLWNLILKCNFNPEKAQTWQKTLEKVVETFLMYSAKNDVVSGHSLKSLFQLQLNMIRTVQFHLSSALLDYIFVISSLLLEREDLNFVEVFESISNCLRLLLKFRAPLIQDRLPSFLQILRLLLVNLCAKSNVELKSEGSEIEKLSDCALKLENNFNGLCVHEKDVARISPYLIADIFSEYERITLLPSVKFHLNNCLYKLLSLCDQHAISYCLRILSTSSTELFKVAYENYKKYYMFTGKV